MTFVSEVKYVAFCIKSLIHVCFDIYTILSFTRVEFRVLSSFKWMLWGVWVCAICSGVRMVVYFGLEFWEMSWWLRWKVRKCVKKNNFWNFFFYLDFEKFFSLCFDATQVHTIVVSVPKSTCSWEKFGLGSSDCLEHDSRRACKTHFVLKVEQHQRDKRHCSWGEEYLRWRS